MKKVSLLFPGQGSQYVGMAKDICEQYSSAKKIFEEANDILKFDLTKLCFQGDIQELTKTENAQPALLTASYATFKVFLEEMDYFPTYLAGHSLGEYSALTCSGAINFADALQIVRKRGELMSQAKSGAMAAVTKLNQYAIEYIINQAVEDGHTISVSNYNSPEQIVISGTEDSLNYVSDLLKEKGANVIPLKVSGAFHSPLMSDAAIELEKELKNYQFNDMKWPVISNVTALPYASNEIIPLLKEQLVKPVQWAQSMNFLRENGIQIAVELGPGSVLKNLMKKNQKYIFTYSYENYEDYKELKEEIESEKKHMPNFLGRALGIAVATKNNNWDENEYQEGVIKPYRKIKQRWLELEKEEEEPHIDDMTEALKMLKSVFETKKTPKEEQAERFEQIFYETRVSKASFSNIDFL